MHVLPALAARNHRYNAKSMSGEEWAEALRHRPGLPRSFLELKLVAARLYGPAPKAAADSRDARPEHRTQVPAARMDRIGPAGSTPNPVVLFPGWGSQRASASELARDFAIGLRNPALTRRQREELDQAAAGNIPDLPWQLMTPHFDIRWTEEDANPFNVLPNSGVAAAIGDALEAAWNCFTSRFGRSPHAAAGGHEGRIPVQIFGGRDGAPSWTDVDAPICLHPYLLGSSPLLRRAAPAFEVFRRMLFAFGYATEFADAERHRDWCTIGMSLWGQWLATGLIGNENQIRLLADLPELDVVADTGGAALPFWIFLDGQKIRSDPAFDGPRCFLETYARLGRFEDSLRSIFAERWRVSPEFLFQLFQLNQLDGRWRGVGEVWRRLPDAPAPFRTVDGQEVAPPPMPRIGQVVTPTLTQPARAEISLPGRGACFVRIDGRHLAGADITARLDSEDGARFWLASLPWRDGEWMPVITAEAGFEFVQIGGRSSVAADAYLLICRDAPSGEPARALLTVTLNGTASDVTDEGQSTRIQ